MWFYWVIFALIAFPAMVHLRKSIPNSEATSPWQIFGVGIFLFLTLTIGLRHEVGGDWFPYLGHVEAMESLGFIDMLDQGGDPAYKSLNWLSQFGFGGVYFVNLVCAAIFTWGLLTFCSIQPRPWLALLVAAPYLVIVVAMGYTRQGVAIGLSMLGLVALHHGSIRRFLLWIALAATFHKSAVLLAIVAIFSQSKRRSLTILGVALTVPLLFVFLLQEEVEYLWANYIEAQYQSAGAAVRIAMNAFPAAFFLVMRRRFIMLEADKFFWTWIAVGALGFVVILLVSPSSTAVDRVALYLIPLQLVVWSHFPDVMGSSGGSNTVWAMPILIYSATVLFVWLYFADMAFAWLPYQFYPWIWLWK